MFRKTCRVLSFFFLEIFSFTNSSHFLGGSFTYKHQSQIIDSKIAKSILVEIRFHISNHFFLCTSEQINKHTIAYLIGEHRWNETIANRKEEDYYFDIQCLSEKHNQACEHFKQQTWGYCESANEKNGYSILKRQFLLIIERFKPLNLYYAACCWANSTMKYFYLNLSIETDLTRINSSPYPYIPASYYVALNQSNRIQIFAFDADDDEIICERYKEDLGGYLTVHANHACQLSYKNDRVGKQFGQFWIMDRSHNRILSRSLISIQVHVLENILCDNQAELILVNQFNHTIIQLNQSIDIFVRLHPNCPLVQPHDQTITEISTLCAHHSPTIWANDGIEVLFQCQFHRCEIYPVCFVGEVGLKLPASDIQCLFIEVTGSENECTKAADEYDFDRPRDRPIIQTKPTDIKLTSESSSPSRNWLWLLLAYLAFLLAGIITYCGCRQMLLLFYNRSFRQQFKEKRRRTTIRRSRRSTEPLLPKHEHIVSKQEKNRTQYLRLGSVDQPKK